MNEKDPLAAKDDRGLCGALHTATLCTTDLDSYRKFFVKILGMTLEGPLKVSESATDIQRQLWKIPEDITWKTYRLHRPEVPSLIQLRILVLDRETPLIHKSYSSRELGPFSLGFPNADQYALDQEMARRGVETMAPVQLGVIERPDGSSYRYIETIYQAPDFLHAVGIERMDGMPQLAPFDEKTKKGGPGYSAMVLKDSDTFLQFLTEVLDLELRADRTWESSPGGALGIEGGVLFRFALVYAKGTSQNHLLFLDYKDGGWEPIDVPPRVPNRGLGMWSFRTVDLDAIETRARRFGSQIVHGPVAYDDPLLGHRRVMTLLAPNGFLIEIFQG